MIEKQESKSFKKLVKKLNGKVEIFFFSKKGTVSESDRYVRFPERIGWSLFTVVQLLQSLNGQEVAHVHPVLEQQLHKGNPAQKS